MGENFTLIVGLNVTPGDRPQCMFNLWAKFYYYLYYLMNVKQVLKELMYSNKWISEIY